MSKTKSTKVWCIENNKLCPRCGEYKLYSEFGKSNAGKNGLTTYCKKCKRDVDKEFQRKTSRSYGSMIKKLYGIDLNEYEEMLKIQGGVCAICGREQAPHEKRFAIDHDHNTGRIRGVLCQNCNHALGNIKDDYVVAQRMVEYLTTYQLTRAFE